MGLTGCSIIASKIQKCETGVFYAVDPTCGAQLAPAFGDATAAQVDAAVAAAESDFDAYRKLPLSQRADFLTVIGEQLQKSKNDLVARASLETALPRTRLEGELVRTVNQLQMFADYIRDGSFLRTRIDPALPDRQPLPRPDLRMTQVPLGPVAVFGASNFPLAFSVVGGDTVAALAAGCPVIVKGHPAHPGTCELAGQAVVRAVEACGMPTGVFSLLQGSGYLLGRQLVQHPLLQAVAFTGSQAGGRALFDLAAARPQPIPVFAEMGSVNPIFMLPQALTSDGEQLARDYAASINLGVGQFCTNPGLLFVQAGPELQPFITSLVSLQSEAVPGTMLHSGIKLNYSSALLRLADRPGVEWLSGFETVADDRQDCRAPAALLQTSAESFLADPLLAEEVFGPVALLVVCASFDQMMRCASALKGQLTATVHAAEEEEELCRELFTLLERKAGRLLLNGFPTGVEVCRAMVHGGPYPATTDSRSTSVGIEALQRFLRPICWQGFPRSLLPQELQG